MLLFAVSASFTADPLERVFSFWSKQLGWETTVELSPYGRVHEAVLDPGGLLGSNTRGINFVLLRWEDLGDTTERVLTNGRELIATLRGRSFRVPLIVSAAPPSPGWRTLSLVLDQELTATPGLEVLTAADVESLYPFGDPASAQGERLGHIPYNDRFFACWGTALVRRAHLRLTPPVKVIATDADDTLWSGVCGEDGPAGVRLTPGREALQRLLLDQRAGGRLLALASKNNPADVAEAFQRHPEFPLRPEHFAAQRVSWIEKSAGLEEMARQLGLGLDSFVFLDDSSKECAAVAQAHPEIVTLPLPHHDDQLEAFLRHVWVFDRGVLTAEDRRRADSYELSAEFTSARGQASTLAEFYASLALDVSLSPLEEGTLPRAAQLTQRTNQFNFSTIRRTEGELRALTEAGWTIQTARVADRFGDYGITGLFIYRICEGVLEVDTFLLSCRVLGRGVEHRIVRTLAEEALAAGATTVAFRFAPTDRNEPARRFLFSLSGHWSDFRFDAATLARVEFVPDRLEQAPPPPAPSGAPSGRPFRDYARIARELATPDQILHAIRGRFELPPEAAAWSPTERQLAEIWSELLERPVHSTTESFFDLGGHSLLAVLLLTRIEETFRVSLSIESVYDSVVTVSSLASRVDAAIAGVTSDDEYAALLAEIAAMSDEEVRESLARESADPPASRPS